MNSWKKSKNSNYYITRNGRTYYVIPNRFKPGTFSLMVQNGVTRYKDLDGNTIVEAVMDASLYIKSRLESRSA